MDRDYEYHPKNAGVSGSGAWYINLSNLTTEKHTEVTIEVPDWEDFGYQDLYDQHVRDCEAGTLSKSDSQVLKQQMQQSIAQQKENLETLQQFHQHQNDSNPNTTELIAVWHERIGTFEQEVKELKDECFKAHKHNPPCSDFDTPYKEHERLCTEEKLTNTLSKKLKAEMQNCIDDNKKLIKQKETSIATYKKNPSWKSSTKIKDEIKKLEDEVDKTTKEIIENEDKLSKLPDECLPKLTGPIPSLKGIKLGSDGFEKLPTYKKRIQEISKWLQDNSFYNVRFTIDAQGGNIIDKSVKSWDQLISGTTKNVTYGKRLDNLLKTIKIDIINASSGKITDKRVVMKRGKLRSNLIYTSIIPQ